MLVFVVGLNMLIYLLPYNFIDCNLQNIQRISYVSRNEHLKMLILSWFTHLYSVSNLPFFHLRNTKLDILKNVSVQMILTFNSKGKKTTTFFFFQNTKLVQENKKKNVMQVWNRICIFGWIIPLLTLSIFVLKSDVCLPLLDCAFNFCLS